MSKEQMINKLIKVLPYSEKWFKALPQHKIFGMYQKYILNK